MFVKELEIYLNDCFYESMGVGESVRVYFG